MISIPESGDPEIYTYADFVLEDFIELKSNDVIEVCMQYPLLDMDMAEKQCFVRMLDELLDRKPHKIGLFITFVTM